MLLPAAVEDARMTGVLCQRPDLVSLCQVSLETRMTATIILDGRQPRTLQLADLMDDMPVEWHRQRERYGIVT